MPDNGGGADQAYGHGKPQLGDTAHGEGTEAENDLMCLFDDCIGESIGEWSVVQCIHAHGECSPAPEVRDLGWLPPIGVIALKARSVTPVGVCWPVCRSLSCSRSQAECNSDPCPGRKCLSVMRPADQNE